MKRTIIIAAAFVYCAYASAQKAETIESFISTKHQPEWYARQIEAWQKKVDAYPKDEWASTFFCHASICRAYHSGWCFVLMNDSMVSAFCAEA